MNCYWVWYFEEEEDFENRENQFRAFIDASSHEEAEELFWAEYGPDMIIDYIEMA